MALSKTVNLKKLEDREDALDGNGVSNCPNIEIVVDGWSFIYIVYQTSKLPWVYGGEYDHFSKAIQFTLTAWMSMGVNLSFVFDGPHETPKFPTIASRLTNSTVHHGALFFRTSHATRSTQRFLSQTRIIPPLVYAACVETVLKLSSRFHDNNNADSPDRFSSESTSVKFPAASSTSIQKEAAKRPIKPTLNVYFADREADPFMVELAGHLGAYVAALDSDFVVINSPGYRGYIPMDEMEWAYEVTPDMDITTRSRTISTFSVSSSIASLLSPSEISADTGAWDDIAQAEDAGFTTVKKKRSRTTSAKAILNAAKARDGILTQRSLIPPPNPTGLTVYVYTPDSTAASLKLPTALLPLFGAFVGNDYSPTKNQGPPISASFPRYSHREFLYEHKMNAVERITYTANNLSSVLQGVGKSGRKGGSGGSKKKQMGILDVIRLTVQQMLLRPGHTTDREIDAIVNRIVENALIYAIPPPPTRDAEQSSSSLWPTPFCPVHAELESCRLDALYPQYEQEEERDDNPQHPSSATDRPRFTTGEPTDPRSMVQRQYLRAYREGALDPSVLDILVTGTMWPRTFLENPDLTSAAGPSEAGGALRRWLYAILDQGIGVYSSPLEEDEGEEQESQATQGETLSSSAVPATKGGQQASKSESEDIEEDEEDEDEIIDVIDDVTDSEPEEDPLLALKGALQRLKGVQAGGHLPNIPNQINESEEDEENNDDDDEEQDPEDLPPLHVTEYVRRGARIAEERILVEDLSTLLDNSTAPSRRSTSSVVPAHPAPGRGLPVPRTSEALPIQLQDERARLVVLLTACASNVQSVIELDRKWTGPVIVARWLIHFSGIKEQQRESEGAVPTAMSRKWSKGEVNALLCAFGADDHPNHHGDVENAWVTPDQEERLEVVERSIQLMAKALSVLEAIRLLVQSLGLAHRVPIRITNFKGRVFHEQCRAITMPPSDPEAQIGAPGMMIEERVWAAVSDQLEVCIGDDPVKKVKKKKDGPSKGQAKPIASKRSAIKGPLFSVLAGMENTI
ncbi:hypothetical protein FRC17_000114 [Serendipita sp. 399]|nr:hypothetical protein FRC17_000114 [Serendipita sp. 399]